MTRIINIMAVEDDVVDQLEIKRTLEKRGVLHRLTLADTGEEAISYLESCKDSPNRLPDIILLDVNLPQMSGLDVHAFIRDCPEWRDIKVFMLTSASETGEILTLSQPGISGVITKPLRLENPVSSAAFDLMIDLMTL